VRVPGGKPLALKAVVKAELSSDEIRRFQREVEVCRELDHRNLLQIFDSGEVDGILYQATDLLEGADLAVVLSRGRSLTWLEKMSLMQQVCEGVEYAHRRGLVHRNLRPSNIFLEDSGRIRVLDFGTVRAENAGGTSLDMSAMLHSYVSPELIQGRPGTAATDVFSLGVIFYEVCAGRHPFIDGGKGIAQILDSIVRRPAAALQGVVPDAPHYLDHVLQQALDKNPSSRPPDAGALRRLMAQASEGQSNSGVTPPPQAKPTPAITDFDATVRLPPRRKTEDKR
jgi:serine/threonine-protein kinase